MNALDNISETQHTVPILSDSEQFHPITSDEVIATIDALQEGDVVPITHAWLVGKFAGHVITIDPTLRANQSPQGRFTQMKNADHIKSNVPETSYSFSVFKDKSPSAVAQALASKIDAVFITHLDSDHLDFDFVKTMTEQNRDMKIYGPLGWQKFIAQTHTFEDEPKEKNKKPLPEHIRTRLLSLSPLSFLGDKPKSLSHFYPKLSPLLHSTTLNKNPNDLLITSLDVPHMGSSYAERVQGFLIETRQGCKLILPDAALSPEVIHLVQKIHAEKKLTGIILSSAKFNPEPFLEIPLTKTSFITAPSPQLSDKLRDTVEEFIGHSAFLPFVLAGITNGTVAIEMIHFGLYHNSFPDITQVPRRIPLSDTPIEDWARKLSEELYRIYEHMDKRISTLGPLTADSEGRHPFAKFLHELQTRLQFSKILIRWIKNNPPPHSILTDTTHEGPVDLPLPLTAR